MQAFLQSLYLELQETGAQATASSGFLSSCWTSLCLPLQSPLADVPLTTGEKRQIGVARAVSIHVLSNRHHWVTVRSLWVNRQRAVQTLHLWQAEVWVPRAAVFFVLHACSSQISSPFLPALKCWKYSAYEDALPVKDCKSVMCKEIFNDTVISTFQWFEKSLKQAFWQQTVLCRPLKCSWVWVWNANS